VDGQRLKSTNGQGDRQSDVVGDIWHRLVETTEDFGVMGGRPSHPELLELARAGFRENGWDVKRFYKQWCCPRPTGNPHGSLHNCSKSIRRTACWRAPRYRMDGEMLRDTALATSGLLVEKIGGPSVKPYQPAGVWEAGSHQGSDTKAYTQDHGEAFVPTQPLHFLETNGNDARYGHLGCAGT